MSAVKLLPLCRISHEYKLGLIVLTEAFHGLSDIGNG